jgi:hypothetical protein
MHLRVALFVCLEWVACSGRNPLGRGGAGMHGQVGTLRHDLDSTGSCVMWQGAQVLQFSPHIAGHATHAVLDWGDGHAIHAGCSVSSHALHCAGLLSATHPCLSCFK